MPGSRWAIRANCSSVSSKRRIAKPSVGQRYSIRSQTSEQFARIAHLLPGKVTDPGRTAVNNRRFVDAVLWILRTGSPWRDLPKRFGPWNSVFQRFGRWAKKGVWPRVFEAVQEPDWEWLMIDASVIRAHQHAAGAPQKK